MSVPSPPPPPPVVDAAGFPTSVSDFASDPRVSWSRQDAKWVLETTDAGLEYQFDEALRRWIPLVCFSLHSSLTRFDVRRSPPLPSPGPQEFHGFPTRLGGSSTT